MVSPFLRQAWTVSAVLINMFGQGMLLSYTSSLLPALMAPDSPIKTDLNTASWLASSAGLSGIPGIFIASYLMDVYGRRLAHALVILPGIVGWTLMYLGTNIPSLMAARILSGMTASGTVSVGSIVIGEFTTPKYRGMFLNLKTAAVCMGGTAVHLLGHFFDWRTIAIIALVPHLIALVIIYTWPESPSWLASKQQFERSETAFYWLRGKSHESYREVEELIKAQMDIASKPRKQLSVLEKVIEFCDRFKRKDFLKPIIIALVGVVLLEACGRHLFPAYALQIIGEITGSKSNSFYFTLTIDMIITVSALCSSLLVKVMKRRTLLFSTGFAAFTVLMTVCTYLFLASRDIVSKERTWIPMSLFVLYFILANLGCTPIPLAFLGELFPLAHRGAGSAVAGVCLSLCVMLGLQLTPHLLVSINVYGTFAVFGTVMGASLTILYFMLPETKDRTLQEIEDYFNFGKFRDQDTHYEEEVKINPMMQE